jgi:hypothetical protein
MFSETGVMSFQRVGSTIAFGFVAAVVALPVQQQRAAAPGIVLAQATQPADTTTKKPKPKVKQKKNDTATQSPPPPTRVGPPDPGKY